MAAGSSGVGMPIKSRPLLSHGGGVERAAQSYGIALENWLDLSTGINPVGWPVPVIPAGLFHSLPDYSEALLTHASAYYNCDSIIAGAGSQAFIQALPRLWQTRVVAVPALGYAEHEASWAACGHEILRYQSTAELEQWLNDGRCNVVLVINPNNPTAQQIEKVQLLRWREILANKHGLLIVDEAFMDIQPERSLACECPLKGLIVLRSLGKFFGLAGIRVGFALAEPELLKCLERELGPWSVSGPSQWIAQQALADIDWQQKTRLVLAAWVCEYQHFLDEILRPVTGRRGKHAHLFISYRVERSLGEHLYQGLAEQAVLVRLIDVDKQQVLLRFGLVDMRVARDLEKLRQCLQGVLSNGAFV